MLLASFGKTVVVDSPKHTFTDLNTSIILIHGKDGCIDLFTALKYTPAAKSFEDLTFSSR